jgi:hypothetical protein
MNEGLDFDKFGQALSTKQYDVAKRMVTPANAKTRGVISYVCAHLTEDDPELLQYFIQMGATLEFDNVLHLAAANNKPRILRALLDAGLDADKLNCSEETALNLSLFYENYQCARILIDAGADVSMVNPDLYFKKIWANEFNLARYRARAASVAVLCVPHASRTVRARRDVFRIIARCVWSTRGLGFTWE